MTEKISVLILLSRKVAKLNTYRYRQISIIDQLLGQTNVYIFNGQILKPEKTFNEYMIGSGDKVFALNHHNLPKGNFNSLDEACQRLLMISKEKNRIEFARLADIQLMQLEQKCFKFQKKSSRICSEIGTSGRFLACGPIISGRMLASDPLPNPWCEK